MSSKKTLYGTNSVFAVLDSISVKQYSKTMLKRQWAMKN